MLWGGGSLLASESTAKDLSDSTIKAIDSTANHGKNSADSITNRSDNSKDLSQNHSNDSTQNIHKHIILAQNENATNPSTTNSSDSNANTTNPNTDSTDSSAVSITPKLAHAYDLGRIERVVKTEIDANSSTTQITNQDFENSASSNVAEALRLTPGVYYGRTKRQQSRDRHKHSWLW